jgi:UDP-glucuronate 4-epimerase
MSKIMITGGAGFIAFHLASSLKAKGHDVFGFDNYNDYYDPSLKRARVDELGKHDIPVYTVDLCSKSDLNELVKKEKPDVVMHLAAHAGVRHSMENPGVYIENNIVGTQNLIEACEEHGVSKLVYASTSCVMAGNQLPWKEDEPTGHQLNPYGYSKRTNECQFKVSKIEHVVGLRFFTVYGPWGRPDMALFTFTKNILDSKPIDVYNYGDMKRDFTYVDDIVQGIEIVINRTLTIDKPINEIYNIGYGQQVNLMDFIHEIEKNFGHVAEKNFLPIHPADTQETWSDTTKLQQLGYKPTTPMTLGVEKFSAWYKHFYGVN